MTTIPLNKLTPYRDNVRKTGITDGLEELTASIAAHGLLQSLVVRKSSRGKFAVIAGQRRFLALSALAERDQVPVDLPVECRVVESHADALEIGLAENVVRRPTHPADQFEAFSGLIHKGSSVADVAARFGVSEGIVSKRMRLGRVSPALLDAYRAEELSLEQIQAFTVSDDHVAQERVWNGFAGHNGNPTSIRQALTEGEIAATDKRVRCVGLDAYEAAGGAVRRDLFDDRNAGYLQDVQLLNQLVDKALEATADAVRAEGWSWVKVIPDHDYDERIAFLRSSPSEVPLSEQNAAERDALQAEFEALSEIGYGDENAETPEITDRLETLEDRIGQLDALTEAWLPEDRAKAGAIIHLNYDGSIEIERGLIPRESVAANDDLSDDAEEVDAPAPSLSSVVVADLTAQRTAALRAALAQNPDVALAAVTHALARTAFYTHSGESCLAIIGKHRPLAASLARPDESTGLFAFDAERGKWTDRLPADADALWTWCSEQTQETLLDLLAVSAAHTLDAVRDKGTRADAPQLLHADALAKALSFHIEDWFTPTAANYFGRIKRESIIDALTEAGLPVRTRSWSKLKKSELATLAEQQIVGTGWLPHPLRIMAEAVQADEAQIDFPAAAAA